jgi:predicted RNase H-like HicB family nuclease
MASWYYALVTRDARTRQYEIEFPDLPGCVSVADSLQEAGAAAMEALAAWIETAVVRDRPIPEPTDIQTQYLKKRHAILMSVPAPAFKVKAVPVTISLNERVLDKIDAAASDAGLTRSAFIAQAALAATAPRRPTPKKRKAA